MGQFRIEKEVLEVTITMVDGEKLEGQLFLALHSSRGDHRETLREILDEGKSFVPVKTVHGGVVLLGAGAVATISFSTLEDPTPEFCRRVKARLMIEGRSELEGDLIVPEGHASFRVSDYLNSGEEWLRLETSGIGVMIAKRAVKEIRLG